MKRGRTYRLEQLERRALLANIGIDLTFGDVGVVATSGHSKLEKLESRRLLSFTPFGGDVQVPGTAGAISLDVAVAANGSFIVAAVVGEGPDAESGDLIAVRYGPDGEQVGEPITIAHDIGQYETISISADAVGNAVVAYGGTSFVLISNRGVVSAPISASPSGGSGAAVAMSANGDFYVAWIRRHNTSADEGESFAEVRAFDAEGHPRGDVFTTSRRVGTGDDQRTR